MGYFYKIYKSDIFIFLDDVQYIKGSYINRNKIKTHMGEHWLTIPSKFNDSSRCKINEVCINNEQDWRSNHLKNIHYNYKRAAYFNEFIPFIQNCLSYNSDNLSDFNINTITKICGLLNIKTRIMLSSQLNIEEKSTMRIIKICEAVGGTKYLSGRGGTKYQDPQMFMDYGIELEYSDFYEKPYSQLWGEFAEGMSIIDYILNCGTDIKSFWNVL